MLSLTQATLHVESKTRKERRGKEDGRKGCGGMAPLGRRSSPGAQGLRRRGPADAPGASAQGEGERSRRGAHLPSSSRFLSNSVGWSFGLSDVEKRNVGIINCQPLRHPERGRWPGLFTPSSFQHDTKNKHGPAETRCRPPWASESASLGRDPVEDRGLRHLG